MRALKHFVGIVGLVVIADYFLFKGYCTNASCELISQACVHILAELQQFRAYF
jgi:hypothetical protein